MTKEEPEILNVLNNKENKKEGIEAEEIEPLTYDKSVDLLIKNLANDKNYIGLKKLKASIIKAKEVSKMEIIIGGLLSSVSIALDTYLISDFGTYSNLIKLFCLLGAGLVTTSSLSVMFEGLSDFKMYDKKIDEITYSLKQ